MIEWVIERLVALLGPIAELRRDQRALADEALRSVSIALTETCLYYRSIETERGRSAEKEAQLARYWAAAAIPVRHIDSELALVCEHKSEYWVNPDSWDRSRLDGLSIALDDVRLRYRSLVKPKRLRARRQVARADT